MLQEVLGMRVIVTLNSQVDEEISIFLVILCHLSPILLCYMWINEVTYFVDKSTFLKLNLGGISCQVY